MSSTSQRILRVFISSTAEDLFEHRRAAASAIEKLGHKPEYFEHTWTAKGGKTVAECIAAAEEADLVIVLAAHRLGTVPNRADGGDDRRSITWIEHDAATARDPGKVLGFIVDPKAPWSHRREQDRLTEDGADAQEVLSAVQRLKEFKELLGGKPCRPFSTPESLAIEVQSAVHVWLVGDRPSQSPLAKAVRTRTDAEREALGHYLRSSVLEWRRVPLVGLDPAESDAGTGKAPDLDRIYVELNATQVGAGNPRNDWPLDLHAIYEVTGQSPSSPALSAKRQPRPALEVAISSPRAVLLGDPGAGKSTFLRMLAVDLAWRCGLEIGAPLPVEAAPGGMASRFDQAYLPVLVVVRDFAADLDAQKRLGSGPTHESLPGFIARAIGRPSKEGCTTLPAVETILALLRQGEAILMLDGLDEVVRSDSKADVLKAIHKFVKHNRDTRILATCRVAAYSPPASAATSENRDARPAFALDSAAFPVFKLAEFDEAQRDMFVDRWYAAQAVAGRLQRDPQRRAASLRQALRGRHLQRMAGNPLLLTVMAIVHGDTGDLPEQRVLLYRDAVEILLRKWRQGCVVGEQDNDEDGKTGAGGEHIEAMLAAAGTSIGPFEGRLWAIAYSVHGGTNAKDSEAVADIPRDLLVRQLAALHANGNKGRGWAEDLIEHLKHRTGLLVERRDGVFTVPHRTFQEYLAARALAKDAKLTEAIGPLARQDIWREVILMVGGTFAHIENNAGRGLPIVESMLKAGVAGDGDFRVPALVLAADVLAEMTKPVVREAYCGPELWSEVTTALHAAMFDEALPIERRASAGSAMGRIGDRRFEERAELRSTDGVLYPDIALAEVIPVGPFPMGNDTRPKVALGDETPRITPTIAEPYAIGRFPVTVEQYRHFIEADGYRPGPCDRHWTANGLAWRNKSGITGPKLFDDHFQTPNHPQVGVSWFEAVAFCRWLSAVSAHVYRLPTEIEWERAARHTDGREYPWGEGQSREAILARANILQRLGGTSPVGLFTHGKAECGAFDLSGNVWEWCDTLWRDTYRDYPLRPAQDDDSSPRSRVVRGGSWSGDPGVARCAARSWGGPDVRGGDLGFRVCVCPCSRSDL
jgi:formylglycine-generating enzyme required for sulfatase activity